MNKIRILTPTMWRSCEDEIRQEVMKLTPVVPGLMGIPAGWPGERKGDRHELLLSGHVWLFCNPMDCKLPGPSVLEIFQARILECIAISSSTGSF